MRTEFTRVVFRGNKSLPKTAGQMPVGQFGDPTRDVGAETARLLRDRFDIPVVYLTAHADRETLDRAKKARPLGYLVKPFQRSELQANIEIALDAHNEPCRVTFPVGRVPLMNRLVILFERGAFHSADSHAVGRLLQLYLLSLGASCLGNITGRVFYALKKTKLLAWVGSAESVVYVGYAYLMAHHFEI